MRPDPPDEGLATPAVAGRPILSELPYEAMFMASPLPASLSRLSDGTLVAVNHAWMTLAGLTREEAIGRTTVELGQWPSEAARQAFVDSLHLGLQKRSLWLADGVEHSVRLHGTVLDGGPEPLLLVYVTEATRELEAERARLETEEALRATNLVLQQRLELHAAIEKLARVGHWTNAADDTEVFWSPGMYEIAGLAPRPVLLRSDVRVGVHPDDRAAWLAARETADGRELDFRWQHPDGQLRWFRTRMSRTMVAGNPQTDFGVVQDVTTEKQASESLAEQLRFIRHIAAHAPGLMYQARLRPDGSSAIPYVNDAAREMLELDPLELQRDAWPLFARVHPDDRPAVLASLQASATRLTVWRQAYRVTLPARGVRWHQVEAVPQREPDGSVLWHGFTTDVTDARLAAQALERQHRMLEAVRHAQALFIEAEDKRQAFEGLLDALLTVTDSEYGFMGEVLYDMREQPYLKMYAMTDIAWDSTSRRLHDEHLKAGMEFRNLQSLFGHALATGETVISNDPGKDPRAGGLPPGHLSMSAFLGIPIPMGDRLVAMVGLANQPGGYGMDDVEFLQPLLGTVRQLVMAWRGHEERKRSRLQFQATSALLAEKTAALQVTFDSMSQGLIMVDAAGRVRFHNQRFLELLDLPASLLDSQPEHAEVVAFQNARGDFGVGLSLVEPDLRPYVGLVPGVQPPPRYVRRTHQGRMLEVVTRTLPEGGMVRTYADVTSYFDAQEALRSERQRLEWVLEATRPGIWETNLETGEMTIDDRWAEMLGYTADELRPATLDTWRRLLHPDDVAYAQEVLQRHWLGEDPFFECDVRMRHKRGHWVWINDRGRVHRRDASGRALYMSGTHLDIHDRVVAQEEVRALNASLERRVAERTAELERSMKDMEVISYSIAHDLRAPLRSVNGFATLIAEEDGERLSPLARDMFGRITRSSRNMGQMISDMLEMLRVVRVELEPAPVDMQVLAQGVLEALAPDAPHARIVLRRLPVVLGDAVLLRQVLSNLTDNALKYSRHREQPEVVIGFDLDRQAFYLQDNGMGFDMARAQKLFGLFQRLHPGSDVPGTGVGLAIVARIIERHGGRIWAESVPDAGTTFWWTLPQA